MNRTEPSHIVNWHPPGCMLPKLTLFRSASLPEVQACALIGNTTFLQPPQQFDQRESLAVNPNVAEILASGEALAHRCIVSATTFPTVS